jgi:hypothetical protein
MAALLGELGGDNDAREGFMAVGHALWTSLCLYGTFVPMKLAYASFQKTCGVMPFLSGGLVGRMRYFRSIMIELPKG